MPNNKEGKEEIWKVEGKDGFDPDAYCHPISEHGGYADALHAANDRLDELDRIQPDAGGQDGIQDLVYIVAPNGTRRRFLRDKDEKYGE